MEIKRKYKRVSEDVDRHGNVRIYFRRNKEPKIRLRGSPGSPEFEAAYQAALRGDLKSTEVGRAVLPAGSFGALCKKYFASNTFRKLDRSTRAWQRHHLERICTRDAAHPVSQLQPHNVRTFRDELSDTPAAANTCLKSLRALFRWAVKQAHETGVTRNPASEVEQITYQSDGHRMWTENEIAQFETRHPIGTMAHLAKEILLCSLGRCEDAVRFGPANIVNGRVQFRQAKNEHRQPVDIDVPLLPSLAEAIAATKATGLRTFLVTKYGKPFSVKGFGNKMRQWCDEAGLPHCSAHGLRKAAATRLADAGASAHEIMAWTGHTTLAEAERYTRRTNRSRLADSGAEKLLRHESRTGIVPLGSPIPNGWDKKAEKR